MHDIIQKIAEKEPIAKKFLEARINNKGLTLTSEEVHLITSSILLGFCHEDILENLLFNDKYKKICK